MAGVRTSTEVVTKAPAEKVTINVDFAANMATGETISTVNEVTPSPSGLTIENISSSGQKAQFQASVGVADTVYRVTVRVTTSTGQVLVNVGKVRVDNP